MSTETIAPADALSRAVHEARRRSGWSGRQLAAAAGVSQATVSRLESGRDVSWSSVAKVLRALPCVDPLLALGVLPVRARQATRASWEGFAEMLGFRARQVALDVRVRADGLQRAEYRVEDLHSTRASTSIAGVRVAVASAALMGDPDLAYEITGKGDLDPGRSFELERQDAVHHYRVRGGTRGRRISYRCRERRHRRAEDSALTRTTLHGRPFREGFSVPLDMPTKELVLRATFVDACRPRAVRPCAWPAGMGLTPDLPLDWWSDLYPHAPRRVAVDSSGIVELCVDHPRAGLAYGLAWDEEALVQHADDAPGPRGSPCRAEAQGARDGGAPVPRLDESPCVVGPPAPRPFGETAASARRAAGLSRRSLAARLGCSPATLHRLETGSEPSLQQVRRYVAALPELSAADVLAGWEAPPPPARLWQESAELFGIHSEEELRKIRVLPDGSLEIEAHSIAFTWEPDADVDLRLRYGLTRAPQTEVEWELESISARHRGSEEPRLSVVRRGRGPLVHDLRLLKRPDSGPVTVIRKLTAKAPSGRPAWETMPVTTAGRAHSVPVKNMNFAPTYPSERLTVELRLPARLWPPRVDLRALPRACAPAWGAEDLLDIIHPEGIGLEQRSRSRTVRFSISRPLIGVNYALAMWASGDEPNEG